jgi:hypothetical protein
MSDLQFRMEGTYRDRGGQYARKSKKVVIFWGTTRAGDMITSNSTLAGDV